jgi:ribosomal protein S18 acetylase RimI-like enzyme
MTADGGFVPSDPVSFPLISWRSFDRADRDACLALFDSNVPDFFLEGERPEFEAFLDDLAGPYVVLLRDGEIVACGGYALRDRGRVADLCWGIVRRDLHGRGFGRELTEGRIARAVAEPRVTEIALKTSQHTVGFYERLGFVTLSVEIDGYGPGLDRCEMRRAVAVG